MGMQIRGRANDTAWTPTGSLQTILTKFFEVPTILACIWVSRRPKAQEVNYFVGPKLFWADRSETISSFSSPKYFGLFSPKLFKLSFPKLFVVNWRSMFVRCEVCIFSRVSSLCVCGRGCVRFSSILETGSSRHNHPFCTMAASPLSSNSQLEHIISLRSSTLLATLYIQI